MKKTVESGDWGLWWAEECLDSENWREGAAERESGTERERGKAFGNDTFQSLWLGQWVAELE